MKKSEKSVVNKIFVIVVCTLLTLYAISIIATLLWGVLTTFKSEGDLYTNGNWLKFPTLDKDDFMGNSRNELFRLFNYRSLFGSAFGLFVEDKGASEPYYTAWGSVVTPTFYPYFPMLLVNTAIYTAVGSLLHTIIPALTAYAVAKNTNIVGKLITGAALFAMTTPIVGGQTSMVAMLKNVGLFDTFWGYLLQKASFTGMYYFVFLAFYESLPDSFAEAAEIDGASQYSILWHIVIPLSMKMLSTVFIIQVVHFWNDYQTANIYMPSWPTIAYYVWYVTARQQDNPPGVQVAASIMLAVPILVAFIFLKKKLMGNVTMGGLKQ